MNNGEGYAYFYWHRANDYDPRCRGFAEASFCRFAWQDMVHKFIPAPKSTRVKLGWFIPNSSSLIITIRNAIKDGKRVVVEPLVNGPLEFFTETP